MILVDTCVLLDVVQADAPWADWSQDQMEHAAEHGRLVINPVIYAELSAWYQDLRELDRVVAAFGATFQELPREALFLAGKAFRQYRAPGGTRASIRPDFFIGAHAAVCELPLLTRDTARICAYFPTVALLAPQKS